MSIDYLIQYQIDHYADIYHERKQNGFFKKRWNYHDWEARVRNRMKPPEPFYREHHGRAHVLLSGYFWNASRGGNAYRDVYSKRKRQKYINNSQALAHFRGLFE